MYKFSILTLSLAAVSLFSACGGGGSDLTQRVPETAVAVATFDMGALLKKANFARFSQTPEYKKMAEKAKEPHRAYLLNPAETGINLDGSVVFFTQFTEAENGTNAALILSVKDEAKIAKWFETSLNAEKTFGSLVDKKGYKMAKLNEAVGEAYVAWDKKIIVFGLINALNQDPAKELLIDKIFKPEGKNINNNPDFAQHAKLKKDAMIWASTDAYFKTLLEGENGATIKMGLGFFSLQEADLTGNSITAYHDFQNGKFESVADFNFSKGLKTQFGDIFKDKPAQTYEKYLPAEKLVGTASIALDLNKLYEALAKRRLNSRIDNDPTLQQLGLNSKNLFNALDGEGCFGFYAGASPKTANDENLNADNNDENTSPDDEPNFDEMYSRSVTPDFDAVFVSGVKDIAPFNKILALPEMAMVLKKQGDIYLFNNPQEGEKDIYIYLSDKILLVSTMEAAALQAAKGGYAANGASAAVGKSMAQGWASFYINFDVWYQAMLENTPNSPQAQMLKTFNGQITNYVGNVQAAKAVATIELKDKSKNFMESYIELLLAAQAK